MSEKELLLLKDFEQFVIGHNGIVVKDYGILVSMKGSNYTSAINEYFDLLENRGRNNEP